MLRVVILLLFFGGTSASVICHKAVDIAMVVDESGSIGKVNYGLIKTFLAEMVTKFSVEDYGAHFGLVKYANAPQIVFNLNAYNNITDLQNFISHMGYRQGGTMTGKAMKMTREQMFGHIGDRTYVPNILVLFSDGQSHDHGTAVAQANQLKKEGVEVLCVGIGNGTVDSQLVAQLKELVTKDDYLFETVFTALNTIEDNLATKVCEAINPCNAHPCLNGGNCVRTGNETYRCDCTVAFEGDHCEIPKNPCNYSSPCLHGGTCVETGSVTYMCECTDYYDGTHCENRLPYVKKGCYLMPRNHDDTMLLNWRPLSFYQWTAGWDDFITDLVEACHQAALAKNHEYFYIEFYGECRVPIHQFNFNSMVKIPGKCWGRRPDYETCDTSVKRPICVGKANAGYVYQII